MLFDGMCGLCAGVVGFLVPLDPAGALRFAPLQGSFAAPVLARHGRSPTALDTLLVVREAGTGRERILSRSDAVLAVAARLPWPWRLFQGLAVVPRPFRDAAYDLVARRRYRWFGRREACLVPTEATRGRFLEA